LVIRTLLSRFNMFDVVLLHFFLMAPYSVEYAESPDHF